MTFEVVKQVDGQFAVKSQIRKGGRWYTAAETFAVPGLGNSEAVALLVADALNAKMHQIRMVQRMVRKMHRRKSVMISGPAKSHKVKNTIKDI